MKSFNSTGRYHNYGHLIKFFCSKSERYYVDNDQPDSKAIVDLSDKNSKSRIKQYIDGSEFLTIKYLFLTNGGTNDGRKVSLNPPSKETFQPTFFKPSHAFIGGGKGIEYIKKYDDLSLVFPILSDPSKKNYNYFFDEAVENSIVNKNGKKWDCRTFAVLYVHGNVLKLFLGNRGFARIESGVKEGLTNLSLVDEKENIEDYMEELHPETVQLINEEFAKVFYTHFVDKLSVEPNFTQSGGQSFVILGIDSILSSSSRYCDPSSKLPFSRSKIGVHFIEVNNGPVMIASKKNIEGQITYDIFEQLIDRILFDEKCDEKVLFEYPLTARLKVSVKSSFTPDLKRKYFSFLEQFDSTIEKRNKEIKHDEYI